MTKSVSSLVRTFLSRNEPAKRGFARTIGSDNGNALATGDFKIKVLKNLDLALGFARFFESGHAVARGRGIGESEAHYGIVLLDFNEFDFL